MQKGDFGVSWFSTRHFLFLVLLFFWSSLQADVSITGLSQSPDPVILGQTPTYTLTVTNTPAPDDPNDPNPNVTFVDIIISITGVSIIDITGPLGCGQEGSTFFCNTDIAGGESQSFQFAWNNAEDVGEYDVTFDVQCSDGTEGCAGDSRTITTSVIAESVSVITQIPSSAAPGDIVTGSFFVVNALPIDSITTTNTESTVTPDWLSAGGGSFDYSLRIPDEAIANEVISTV